MCEKQPLEFGSPPIMCNLSDKINSSEILEAKPDPNQAKLNSDLGGWIFKANPDPNQAKA